jgi:hypothetical protein
VRRASPEARQALATQQVLASSRRKRFCGRHGRLILVMIVLPEGKEKRPRIAPAGVERGFPHYRENLTKNLLNLQLSEMPAMLTPPERRAMIPA